MIPLLKSINGLPFERGRVQERLKEKIALLFSTEQKCFGGKARVSFTKELRCSFFDSFPLISSLSFLQRELGQCGGTVII